MKNAVARHLRCISPRRSSRFDYVSSLNSEDVLEVRHNAENHVVAPAYLWLAQKRHWIYKSTRLSANGQNPPQGLVEAIFEKRLLSITSRSVFDPTQARHKNLKTKFSNASYISYINSVHNRVQSLRLCTRIAKQIFYE